MIQFNMRHRLQIPLHRLGLMVVVGLLSLPDPLHSQTGQIPASYSELWSSYDPRAEPLDTEILHSWEQEGITFHVVRYRVGTFRGTIAKVAAIYGHPTGQKNLPGLVQIHGGGQHADANAVLTNGKRGYATISVAWAGRINAPDYHINSDVVQLFWEGKSADPRYRITTDWGAVDGYHAPSRYQETVFPSARAHPWTIDAVESPRNSGWYLCALAARRALTFLEQQSEVDPDRLGVYGHSMGGKLTVMTAPDPRVKAVAPSCGGISDRENQSSLFEQTLGDPVYLKQIRCPIFFLSPSNDFHGRIDDLQSAVTEIASNEFRMNCSPHHNHQDTPEYEVATQLWFDAHLQGKRDLPQTPRLQIDWAAAGGMAQLRVTPDSSQPINAVHVYYTRQGEPTEQSNKHENTIARFWHHLPMAQQGTEWIGDLQIFFCSEKPLWIYANTTYQLAAPISGAGYYYRTYTANEFVLSTKMAIISPTTLSEMKIKPVSGDSKDLVIEDFQGDWRQEWFTYNREEWSIRTHKVYAERWQAPSDNARLVLTVQSDHSNPIVIGIDNFVAEISLAGVPDLETFELSLSDFHAADGTVLNTWQGIKELRLGNQDRLRSKTGSKLIGGTWQGGPPKFQKLSWR